MEWWQRWYYGNGMDVMLQKLLGTFDPKDFGWKRVRVSRTVTLLITIILRPKWIVDADNVLGVRIWGINFLYHKWTSPLVMTGKWERPFWRYARKREFGEEIPSQRADEADALPTT